MYFCTQQEMFSCVCLFVCQFVRVGQFCVCVCVCVLHVGDGPILDLIKDDNSITCSCGSFQFE